ncbi:MAG: hypothetical protein VXZ99_17190 [Pseudomonadota bacterium]|nr:hypothetical protein [Pseudomonadota bacterium]MEC7537503.1 hypothetical protein [Pseudomonadota bacterium]MEC7658380.1 hypothetical protein [Pseudomonadota bacterium]MEC8372535.1 hypothetical protein [Pseudomonadota bacterium]MEC8698745.1 hypothetical protein [Pseudomonadota bacterium]
MLVLAAAFTTNSDKVWADAAIDQILQLIVGGEAKHPAVRSLKVGLAQIGEVEIAIGYAV